MLVSTPGLIQKATQSTLACCHDVDLVAIASGALSATEALARSQPDILLIDANVPDDEMDALLKWAKSRYPRLCSVVATASSERSSHALKCGAHATVHRANLAEQLNAILSGLIAAS